MKSPFHFLILFSTLCVSALAVIITQIEAPGDNPGTRIEIRERPELKDLATDYQALTKTHFSSRKQDDIARTLGPKLEQRSDDRRLPVFAPSGLALPGARYIDMTKNRNHIDFHLIGDFAYVAVYYGIDGTSIEACVFYFRADDNFVPLKTADDFSKRLEWDKTKFAALKTWLAEHLPPK